MNQSEFTYKQIDAICYLIGEWYLFWKNRLADWEAQDHCLEFACEHLKRLLIEFNLRGLKLSAQQSEWIEANINIWRSEWNDKMFNFDDETHNFGHAKEHLKMMICPITLKD